MRASGRNRLRPCLAAVRRWQLWQLPRWLVYFLFLMIAAYVAAVTVATRYASLSAHGLLLLGVLLACLAVTVEMTKREGESAVHTLDVYAVWELPIAILLPPLYALAVPVCQEALNQWRVRRVPPHRRVYTAAVTGLAYGAASLTFHAVTGTALNADPSPLAHPAVWVAAIAAAGVIRWFLNVSLVMPAVKGTDITVKIRTLLFSQGTVHNDVTELCVAVLVTSGIAISPLTIIFAVPFVTLLQRSFRHEQLVSASRIDSKTGLLNAGTWEREASSEVARAVRTRSPLAVALIDVDRFKAVNDTYGHLVGDKTLQAIARTLKAFIREYDLVGRFGGEEFALLLPQARPVDAYTIAERIRAYIGSMPIEVSSGADGEPITVTISVGVAALGANWDTSVGSQLTDLLAAADMALYQAKRSGRDQVCVITENATFGSQPRAEHAPQLN